MSRCSSRARALSELLSGSWASCCLWHMEAKEHQVILFGIYLLGIWQCRSAAVGMWPLEISMRHGEQSLSLKMSISNPLNSINNYSFIFLPTLKLIHIGSLYSVNHMSYHIASHHHCFCTFSALDSHALLRLLWVREIELLLCLSANSYKWRCAFSLSGEKSNTVNTGWPMC